jgi:hypothetical protein
MNSLRLEADEAVAKVEELQARVKTLEQENLAKEQEITSLQHNNGLLQSEVEKLETAITDFKKVADEGQEFGTQKETLQRRLQLLEDEAEEADKTLREANEKYVSYHIICDSSTPSHTPTSHHIDLAPAKTSANSFLTGFDKLMSRPDISSARSRPSRMSAISGSRNTKKWQRNMRTCRRSWRSSRMRSETSNCTFLASTPFCRPTPRLCGWTFVGTTKEHSRMEAC